jgi:uncharacterized protein with HEPN domain
MRRDRQRIEDILEALDSVARMTSGTTEAEFLSDERSRYAVAQRLIVVGEAAARITSEVRQKYASIPWSDIIALRNILVHEYFGIDWRLVWQTATSEAAGLRKKISEINAQEFGGD